MGRRTKSKPSESRRAKSSSWMCFALASPRSSLCDSQWLTFVPRWILKLFTPSFFSLFCVQAVSAISSTAKEKNTFFIIF